MLNNEKYVKSARWRLFSPCSVNNIQLYNRNQVSVHYHSRFTAISNSSLSKQIDLTWQAILQKAQLQNRIKLFDQPKFRLDSISFKPDKMIFRLGPTTYKNYISIRTTPFLLGQIKDRAKRDGLDISKFLPNVIGNVALIITKDFRSIAINRSQCVSVYKGYLDLPGGHPEPHRINENLWDVANKKHDLEVRICDELFSSVLREVEDDIGVQTSHFSEPKLCFILQNMKNIRKPDMVFVVRTDLNSNEIYLHWQQNSKNFKEVREIMVFNPFKPTTELKQYKLTPIMEGVLYLFQRNFNKLEIHPLGNM